MDRIRDACENRRLAALQIKLESQKAQTSLIKQAISGNMPNKRIVFDERPKLCEKVDKVKLFDEEQEEDNEDESKKQIESFAFKNKRIKADKEAKLIELQSRFAHDSRFKINERFLEDADDDDDQVKRNNLHSNENEGKNEEDITEMDPEKEKEKALEVLEEVLGKPLKKETVKPQSSLIIPRFDPSKPEAAKFIIKKTKNSKDGLLKSSEAKNDSNPSQKVSKERFYEINETITGGLKPSQGFSFANLFGYKDDDIQEKDGESNERKDGKQSGGFFDEENDEEEEGDDSSQDNESLNEESESSDNCVTLRNKRSENSAKKIKLGSSSNSQSGDVYTSHELINASKIKETKGKEKLKSSQKSENVISNPLLKYEKFFLDYNDERLKKDVFYQPEIIESHLKQWKEKRIQMITVRYFILIIM